MLFKLKVLIYLTIGSFLSFINISTIKIIFGLKKDLFKLEIDRNLPIVILGTGSSINNVSKTEWEIISKYNSVGINQFLYHEFVPNIIQLEIREGDDKEYFNNLNKILSKKKEKFKSSIILIKSNYTYTYKDFKDKVDFIQKIPNELKGNLKFTIDFPLPAKTLSEYKVGIKLLKFIGLFKVNSLLFTPHLRSSIGLTTALAVKYNINQIFFGGVDLNNRMNFYNLDYLSYKYNLKLEVNKVIGPHLTNDKCVSELTIVNVLKIIISEFDLFHKISTFSKESELVNIMTYKKLSKI